MLLPVCLSGRRVKGKCMGDEIRTEYEKTRLKRDELRRELDRLEQETPKNEYQITITRDRLAYWEGRLEGIGFCLERSRR